MRALTLVVCLVGLSVVGCKGKRSRQTQADKSAATGQDKDAQLAAPTEQPTRQPIADADVQAIIDRWLKAQNNGDFDSYAALYADKFTGVKRAGPRTSRFAREGWLADRKRMFKRPMKVEAKDVEISTTPTTAQVHFVQYWASGKFADQGPKRMLIVRDGDTLEIAQEEMLRSNLVDGTPNQGDGQLYFLLEGGVALPDAAVLDTIGKLELDDGEPMVASARLAESALQTDVRSYQGKTFRTNSGCEAKVVGFSVVSRATPHFGTVHEWDCRSGEDGCVPTSDAERAETIYSSGTPVVVAELDGCTNDRYAWLAESTAPVAAEVMAEPNIEEKALSAFARLSAVSGQGDAEHATWYQGNEVVQVFKHPGTGDILVSVMADTQGMCGEFAASHWQLWRYENGKLIEMAGGTPPLEILEAIDADGDGTLEFVVRGDNFGTELALIDSEGLQPLLERSYSYNDCPC